MVWVSWKGDILGILMQDQEFACMEKSVKRKVKIAEMSQGSDFKTRATIQLFKEKSLV